MTDTGEVMLYRVPIKDPVFLQNIFQQLSQLRDIPLAVAESIDELSLSIFRNHLEGLVEYPGWPI